MIFLQIRLLRRRHLPQPDEPRRPNPSRRRPLRRLKIKIQLPPLRPLRPTPLEPHTLTDPDPSSLAPAPAQEGSTPDAAPQRSTSSKQRTTNSARAKSPRHRRSSLRSRMTTSTGTRLATSGRYIIVLIRGQILICAWPLSLSPSCTRRVWVVLADTLFFI